MQKQIRKWVGFEQVRYSRKYTQREEHIGSSLLIGLNLTLLDVLHRKYL